MYVYAHTYKKYANAEADEFCDSDEQRAQAKRRIISQEINIKIKR
jgi:hypothetical protein